MIYNKIGELLNQDKVYSIYYYFLEYYEYAVF